MTGATCELGHARLRELAQSAAAVRAGADAEEIGGRSWRRIATTAAYVVALAGLTVAALHAADRATPVLADSTANGALFSLTNQDRASNGVRAMSGYGTLSNIAEGAGYNCSGINVHGRAVDMIERNYFAHPIAGCGQLVFSMMRAYGVPYRSAGENIGWNSGGSANAAASQIENAFMNSPDHRSNILNGNYTNFGVGSAYSGSNAWTGGGGSYTNVWMFAVEFAQLASAPPPPPPPPPPHTPRPTARPGTTGSSSGSGSAGHNGPVAPAPVQPPAVAPAPAPVATAVPTPTPTPAPTPLPTFTLPPWQPNPGGLLFDSVESVLESYLIT
jgi:uncharacterized protein YkwD